MKTKEEIINDSHFKVCYDENGKEIMLKEHCLEAMEAYRNQFVTYYDDARVNFKLTKRDPYDWPYESNE